MVLGGAWTEMNSWRWERISCLTRGTRHQSSCTASPPHARLSCLCAPSLSVASCPSWWRRVWARNCKIERSFWCHKWVIVVMWMRNPPTRSYVWVLHIEGESESEAMSVTSWSLLMLEDCTPKGIAPWRCHQHSLRSADNSRSTEVEYHRKSLSPALCPSTICASGENAMFHCGLPLRELLTDRKKKRCNYSLLLFMRINKIPFKKPGDQCHPGPKSWRFFPVALTVSFIFGFSLP